MNYARCQLSGIIALHTVLLIEGEMFDMKQHTTPLVIKGNQSTRLEKISLNDNSYNETWIQQICYNNPNTLPIDEFEPSFGGIIPICQELPTQSGYCDLIYVNENGFITIGECKLWRNPEARRKVVGQILDYAKDIARWNYQEFEAACIKARKQKESSLYEIMQAYFPDIEEQEFIDRVQNNLRRGRFLLLVIGDGIRENMEDLVEYLQGNNSLNFALALVEIPVYKNPANDELIITPRLLAKTKEIERTIIRIVDQSYDAKQESVEIDSRGQTISEQDFYERLAANRGHHISQQLEDFVNDLVSEHNLTPKPGRGKRRSLNIKSADDTYNFVSVQETGEVWFYAIVAKTEELGDRQIGIDYLKSLAKLVDGKLDTRLNHWYWGVKKRGQYMMIDEYLKHKAEWKELIGNTLRRIWEFEEE